ncbi:MAG: dihydropyrimidinase [Cetobacterium sp.]|uniref:dihydropyrimidinase n=1 Tax=Cetobacterium sp. TaxID=2071632 RepID=UPI002FC62FFB
MILKNGTILRNDKMELLDILIEDGKIKKIDFDIQEENQEVVDLSGKYIVPGAIDVHTHFDIDVGIKSVDDFISGSIAAACGGTTTIIDHPGFGPRGCSLEYMIDKYMINAKFSHIDYSFHGVVQELNENTYEELQKLKSRGINSFKIYLTYLYKQNDYEIITLFEYAKRLDMIVAVHAENDSVIQYFKEKFQAEKKLDITYHSHSRPNDVEAEAVCRLIKLANIINYEKLYLVHISTKEAMEQISIAKLEGKKVYVETCTQYLYLNNDNYLKQDAIKYVLSPPLREDKDIKSLWENLRKGNIDIIATDHCSFSLNQKLKGNTNFLNCPNGIPGVEERNLIFFSEVLNGKMSVKEYLDLLVLNPAKIFGMEKFKGSIDVGKDADLVVFEKIENILDEEKLHSKSKYSCFNGFKLLSKIDKTYLRGDMIVNSGIFLEKSPKGKFIERN